MSDVNKVLIGGRVMQAPQLDTVGSGNHKLRLRVGTTEHGRGDKEFKAYHTLTLWGDQAVDIAGKVNEGSRVFAEASLRYGSYEKEGRKVYTTDLVVKSISITGDPKGAGAPQREAKPLPAGFGDIGEEDGDSLPF